MSDFAKFIPSETEEGSPGPLEKNTPWGLFSRTSFKDDREGKTIISHPWETNLFKIDFFIPKSIATIFNLLKFFECLENCKNYLSFCKASI